jgi:hypothetical protein
MIAEEAFPRRGNCRYVGLSRVLLAIGSNENKCLSGKALPTRVSDITRSTGHCVRNDICPAQGRCADVEPTAGAVPADIVATMP